MPKHRSGGKFTAAHSSVTDDAAVVVDAAAKLEAVTKISLCTIKRMSGRKRHLIFREIPAGWMVKVCGTQAVQQLVIFTGDRAVVKETLERVFS